jgi:hypothetical protein
MKNSLRRRGPTKSFTNIPRRGSLQRLSKKNTTKSSSCSAFHCGTILAVLAAALVIDPRRHRAPFAASGFSLLDHHRPSLASRLRSHRAAVSSSASSTSDKNSARALVNNNSDDDNDEEWDGSTVVQMDHYDVVTVDLDAGRDYPIYIGTGYSDEEGTAQRPFGLGTVGAEVVSACPLTFVSFFLYNSC